MIINYLSIGFIYKHNNLIKYFII